MDGVGELQIKSTFYLFLFPCLTRITREMMKDTGIIDLVTVLDTNMDLYPLDDDILSLEWYSSFSLCFGDSFDSQRSTSQ